MGRVGGGSSRPFDGLSIVGRKRPSPSPLHISCTPGPPSGTPAPRASSTSWAWRQRSTAPETLPTPVSGPEPKTFRDLSEIL